MRIKTALATPKGKIYFIWRAYKNEINMTRAEFRRWARSPCSLKASLDRKPIVINDRLLSTKRSEWTMTDANSALKTIRFLRRMKKVKPGNIIKDCGMSRRDIALKNWAYDPKKK